MKAKTMMNDRYRDHHGRQARAERFWPMSREKTPKQLITLLNVKRSFLQQAVDRVLPLVPLKNIFDHHERGASAGSAPTVAEVARSKT